MFFTINRIAGLNWILPELLDPGPKNPSPWKLSEVLLSDPGKHSAEPSGRVVTIVARNDQPYSVIDHTNLFKAQNNNYAKEQQKKRVPQKNLEFLRQLGTFWVSHHWFPEASCQ